MTTREECVADAGAVYGSILADPVRGPEIRAARAKASAAAAINAARSAPQSAAGRTPGGVSAGSPTTNPNQQRKQSA